jgi:hypothetical protein
VRGSLKWSDVVVESWIQRHVTRATSAAFVQFDKEPLRASWAISR